MQQESIMMDEQTLIAEKVNKEIDNYTEAQKVALYEKVEKDLLHIRRTTGGELRSQRLFNYCKKLTAAQRVIWQRVGTDIRLANQTEEQRIKELKFNQAYNEMQIEIQEESGGTHLTKEQEARIRAQIAEAKAN